MSLEAVVKLVFFVVIATGNMLSSFRIGADELVVAMCVEAIDSFAHKSELCLWKAW